MVSIRCANSQDDSWSTAELGGVQRLLMHLFLHLSILLNNININHLIYPISHQILAHA